MGSADSAQEEESKSAKTERANGNARRAMQCVIWKNFRSSFVQLDPAQKGGVGPLFVTMGERVLSDSLN